MLALPFAALALPMAFTAWSALGTGTLAWALARAGRPVWPVLLSPSAVLALRVGQWTPWLAAALLVPTLGAVLAAKPTLGAAIFGARPTRRALVGGVLVTAASLAWHPTWPVEWLANLAHVRGHPAPLLTPLGAPVLLALLRWRRPEARLLVLYAAVPQLLFFADQLPLLLVARRRREALALLVAGWGAAVAWFATLPAWTSEAPRAAAPWVLAGVYLPCLLLVLARPNAGALPPRLEAAVARLRLPRRLAFLRGTATDATGDGWAGGA